MKKSARNRIIIWSVVSLILIGLLAAGIIGIRNYGAFDLKLFSFEVTNAEFDKMSVGGSSVDSSEIKSIDINWASGEIELKNGDTDKIKFSDGFSSDTNDADAMRWQIDNGKLEIYESKNSYGIFNFNSPQKKLTITLPKEKYFEEFEINTASANIKVEEVNAGEGRFETASGSITVNSFEGGEADVSTVSGETEINIVSAEKVKIESVSGKCQIGGTINEIDASGISGDFNFEVQNNIKKIHAETVSGDICAKVYDNIGFRAKHDSVSGSFSCEFEGVDSTEGFVCGSGESDFDFWTISGDVKIQKLDGE